ncbi:MAG: chloride channel protein [Clostridia bacterium]|nr:chloride channel protein [Clostridia bacterium]
MIIGEYIKNTSRIAVKYAVAFFKWLGFGLLIGVLCGLIGAAFHYAVDGVTVFRNEHKWVLLLLPFLCLVTVAVYKLCRVSGVGTDDVLESVRDKKGVSPLLAPAVFMGSVITHLVGGSAGREGAALQLGGSVASLVSRTFKLEDKTRHIVTMCGMAAVFSAVFGTPVCACIFALEVTSVGRFRSGAFFPTLVSSVTASFTAKLLGVKAHPLNVDFVPQVNGLNVVKLGAIVIAGALVSMLFCLALRISEKLFSSIAPNPYLRIMLGGGVILLLTLLLRTTDYNGSGMEGIVSIFEGDQVVFYAFLLKIIFTAITVGSGFKGGEIIPALFTGAALGCALGGILGIDTVFGAAIGMAALFSGVTNCPIATVILCVELFGGEGIVFYAVSAVTSFLLSGYTGLYTSQKLLFSKTDDSDIERNAG